MPHPLVSVGPLPFPKQSLLSCLVCCCCDGGGGSGGGGGYHCHCDGSGSGGNLETRTYYVASVGPHHTAIWPRLDY